MMFIVILDHENMGIDTIFVSLSCVLFEILKKVDFSIMAVANLHIGIADIHLTTSNDVYRNP